MAGAGILITPSQYERGLEGLNEIRPLARVDTVRYALSLPVLNVNPVNDSPIAQGKVLRCDNNGAVLGANNNGLTLAGTDFYRINDDFKHKVYDFDVKVRLIYIRVEFLSSTGRVAWWDEEWLINICDITATGRYYLPFNGVKFNLGYNGFGEGETIFYFSWFT